MIRCFRRSGLHACQVLLSALLLLGVPQASWAVQVVASFSILADLVQQVGGDRVQVTSLVGPEQDSHVFQPRPSDLTTLQHADLVVVNGLGFEGWLTRLIQSADYQGVVSVATEGIEPLFQSASGRRHAMPDPHAWQDPQRVQQYVHNIAQALSQADPANAADYAARAQAYQQQLQALDAQIQAQFRELRTAQPTVVTPHAAMHYFGERYGLKFLAAQGASTATEPGSRNVAELIRRLRGLPTTVIFTESQGVPALLRQVAAETGLAIQGRLYSDTLSAPNGPAANYLQLMQHNAQQLHDALQQSQAHSG